MNHKTANMMILLLGIACLFACTRQIAILSDTNEKQMPIAAPEEVFAHLERFQGEAPGVLMRDPTIGPLIRSTLPANTLDCVQEFLAYLPDLSFSKEGHLHSALYGSIAENQMLGIMEITPERDSNLLLGCHDGPNHSLNYYLMTTRAPSTAVSETVRDWMLDISLVEGNVVVYPNTHQLTRLSARQLLNAPAPTSSPEKG